jgi:hypothetical protein
MKPPSMLGLSAIGVAAMLAPTVAVAGNCLSRPAPFVLQSDIAEWSMVVGRGSECIQGLRGRTMVLEGVSVLEQPKSGQIILRGPSFRYSAGPETGSDTFKLAMVGTSMRIHGSSVINIDVQIR